VRVPVFVNQGARGCGPDVLARLRDAFEQAGMTPDLVLVDPDEIEPALRAAAADSALVAVGGGDGTQSAAAGVLAGGHATLLPLPLGTFNHFAKRLGIRSCEDAARAAVAGHTVRLPVGSVNGRPFVNNVSIGIYPRFVRTRERLRPKIGYAAASGLAGLYALLRLHRVHLEIEACDARGHRAVAGIWFGLGRGSFRLPEDAEPIAARTLEMAIAPGRTRLRLVVDALRTVGSLRRGDPPQQAGLEILHAPMLKLWSAGLLDLARDGEAERVTPPVTLMVLEGALQVRSLEPIAEMDRPGRCPDPAALTTPAV
jgi:diacylglycerol kinase family enzyme